jgi:Flp pilus assembly protein TadD/uncharacterized RDD family membrane protein YckC
MDHGAGAPVELAPEGKGAGPRAGAYLLDSILLFFWGIAVVLLGPLVLGKTLVAGYAFYAAKLRTDVSVRTLSYLLALLMGIVFFALCEWLYGATPGKLLLRLRVVKTNGARCSLAGALIRGALRLVDGLFFGIPAFVSMEPPLQQRIGDRAARTMVVGTRSPLIQQRRSLWWLLVALGLYLMISVSAQAALVRYADRGAAPGDVYVEQAVAARATGDHARAAELLQRAIDAGIPQDRLPNIHFLLGNEYYLLGDVEKAIRAQDRALEIDPAFSPSWLSLGTAYQAIGEPDRAEECYRRAVELTPDRPEGYVSLGWLSLEQGDIEQALDLLDQALQVDPHSGTAYAYQAVAYALQGRFEQAHASLELARKNGYADWQLLQELTEGWEAGWQEP